MWLYFTSGFGMARMVLVDWLPFQIVFGAK